MTRHERKRTTRYDRLTPDDRTDAVIGIICLICFFGSLLLWGEAFGY